MNSKVIGSALLIAGTCIGAVMIVIPITLLPLGSFGVFAMLVISQLLMAYSGILIFEVAATFPKGTDLAAMASAIIGPWAGSLVNMLFSLLLYCLLASYLTGGSALLAESGPWHNWGIGFWAVLGVLFLMLSMRAQDWLNRLFMLLLVVSFIAFVGGASQHLRLVNITSVPFTSFWPSIAVLATAFGYHVIIPSLRDYLDNDIGLYKQTLFLGLSVPLVLYVVWCFSLYGLLPYHGEFGLLHLSQMSNAFIHIQDYLSQLLASRLIPISMFIFMLTSILSSYVGIALSLMQAVSNKFKINVGFRSMVVILPPAVFAILMPGSFLLTLKYAALIVAIISLFLPVVMVVRSQLNLTLARKLSLAIIVLYGFAVIYSAIA